jgi:hypothetical protein
VVNRVAKVAAKQVAAFVAFLAPVAVVAVVGWEQVLAAFKLVRSFGAAPRLKPLRPLLVELAKRPDQENKKG